MNKIPLGLYENSSDLEESQLRSVLLFSNFGSKHGDNSDMIRRLVLSVFVGSDTPKSSDEVWKILNENFLIQLKQKEVNKHIRHLESDHLLISLPEGKYKATDNEQSGRLFFKQLNVETDALIDGIYRRFEKLQNKSALNIVTVKSHIRKALSIYLKMSGLSFFRLQKPKQNVNSAIQPLFADIDKSSGQRLVTAIAETLQDPTEDEKRVLELWAKAYLLTQILNLDPTLDQFKKDQLRHKSFVLDTDVVLNSLTTHAQLSSVYRDMLTYLTRLGCPIYIPHEVFREVEGSARQAIEQADQLSREQMLEFDGWLLRGSSCNVFIEDYINLIRQDPDKHDLDFSTYIGNIYNAQNKSVLRKRLSEIVGSSNVDRELPDVHIDAETEKKLNTIIYERTSATSKGSKRSESFNEKVARADTKLYLTLVHCNKYGNSNLVQEGSLMPYKYYSLTESTRTIKSAEQLGIYTDDIICHPKALMAVLDELGEISDKEIHILNLLENPFLVHTATSIWDKIQSIIKNGAHVYHSDIQQLKAEVEEYFDELLCSKTLPERIQSSHNLAQRGYQFAADISILAGRVEERNQKLQQLETLIAQQNAIIQKLEKEKRKTDYTMRLRQQPAHKKAMKSKGKKRR